MEHVDKLDISSSFWEMAISEISRVASRSRKKRRKLLDRIVPYLERLVFEASMNSEVMQDIVDRMEVLIKLFLSSLTLLLPLSDLSSDLESISRISGDFGEALEGLLSNLNTWCFSEKGRPSFFELTSTLLTQLLNVVDNTESWFYSIVIEGSLAFIVWCWGEKECYAEDRICWSRNVVRTMYALAKKVVKGGDFSCQYGLIIIIQQWLLWVDKPVACTFLNTAFSLVDSSIRKWLLDQADLDFDYCGRLFLNAFNSCARGLNLVKSIPCAYVFVGNEEIKPPEHDHLTDFWIDFSFGSRRIHILCAIPDNGWVHLNIRADQVDSVCLSWLRKDFSKSQCNTQGSDTQISKLSHLTYDSLMFLHICLKEDFDLLSKELFEYCGKGHRSLIIVFKEVGVVERTLDRMRLPVHSIQQQTKVNLNFSQAVNMDIESVAIKEEPLDTTVRLKDTLSEISLGIELNLNRLEVELSSTTNCRARKDKTLDTEDTRSDVMSPSGIQLNKSNMDEDLEIQCAQNYLAKVQLSPKMTSIVDKENAEHPNPETIPGKCNRGLQSPNSTTSIENDKELECKENILITQEITKTSLCENQSLNTTNVMETPTGFHLFDSTDEEESECDKEAWNRRSRRRQSNMMNISSMTAESCMEDPIPRSCRNKVVGNIPRTPFQEDRGSQETFISTELMSEEIEILNVSKTNDGIQTPFPVLHTAFTGIMSPEFSSEISSIADVEREMFVGRPALTLSPDLAISPIVCKLLENIPKTPKVVRGSPTSEKLKSPSVSDETPSMNVRKTSKNRVQTPYTIFMSSQRQSAIIHVDDEDNLEKESGEKISISHDLKRNSILCSTPKRNTQCSLPESINPVNSDIWIYSDEEFLPIPLKENPPNRKNGKGYIGGCPKKPRKIANNKPKNKPNSIHSSSVPKSLLHTIQNVLPVKVINPTPKVLNRTPCYSLKNNNQSENPQKASNVNTQFVDPYDFERTYDFISNKNKVRMKTYNRKRKRSSENEIGIPSLKKKMATNDHDSDNSIDVILEKLASNKPQRKVKGKVFKKIQTKTKEKRTQKTSGRKNDGNSSSVAEKPSRQRASKVKKNSKLTNDAKILHDEDLEKIGTIKPKRPYRKRIKSKIALEKTLKLGAGEEFVEKQKKSSKLASKLNAGMKPAEKSKKASGPSEKQTDILDYDSDNLFGSLSPETKNRSVLLEVQKPLRSENLVFRPAVGTTSPTKSVDDSDSWNLSTHSLFRSPNVSGMEKAFKQTTTNDVPIIDDVATTTLAAIDKHNCSLDDNSDDWYLGPNPLYVDGPEFFPAKSSDQQSINNEDISIISEDEEECLSPAQNSVLDRTNCESPSGYSVFIKPLHFSPISVASCFSFAHDFRASESQRTSASESELRNVMTKQNTQSNSKAVAVIPIMNDEDDDDSDDWKELVLTKESNKHQDKELKINNTVESKNLELNDTFDWDQLDI